MGARPPLWVTLAEQGGQTSEFEGAVLRHALGGFEASGGKYVIAGLHAFSRISRCAGGVTAQ